MPLPAEVDIDKLLSIVLDSTKVAIAGWLRGAPRDETALMNRVSEQLTRTRRGCDVGTFERVVVRSRIAVLHRRAKDNSDLFGADIAVTVLAEPNGFMKTALFQLKKGNGFQAQLEKEQLDDMLESDMTRRRAFVLYADEERTGVRIGHVPDLSREYSPGQRYKTFGTASWQPLSLWLAKWLTCEIGPESDINDPGTIESILTQYEVESPFPQPAAEPLDTMAWLLFALWPPDFEFGGTPQRRYLP